MQAAKLTLAGGAGTVKAPCACEAVDVISLTATFNFQYADNSGNAIGDPVAAAQISATYFEFKVDCGGKGFAWSAGQTIGFITGGGATDNIGIRPRVIGH